MCLCFILNMSETYKDTKSFFPDHSIRPLNLMRVFFFRCDWLGISWEPSEKLAAKQWKMELEGYPMSAGARFILFYQSDSISQYLNGIHNAIQRKEEILISIHRTY